MKNKKIDYKFYTILTFAILIILITIFANYLAPYNPDYQNYDAISQAPNSLIYQEQIMQAEIFYQEYYMEVGIPY